MANTDIDDTSATNTTFEDGQYGFVVYDDDSAVVKAAFIIRTYLTEDPTGDRPNRPEVGELEIVIDGSDILVYNPENESKTAISEAIDATLTNDGYTDIKIPYNNLYGADAITAKRGNVEYSFTAKLAKNGGTEKSPVAVTSAMKNEDGEIILAPACSPWALSARTRTSLAMATPLLFLPRQQQRV